MEQFAGFLHEYEIIFVFLVDQLANVGLLEPPINGGTNDREDLSPNEILLNRAIRCCVISGYPEGSG